MSPTPGSLILLLASPSDPGRGLRGKAETVLAASPRGDGGSQPGSHAPRPATAPSLVREMADPSSPEQE